MLFTRLEKFSEVVLIKQLVLLVSASQKREVCLLRDLKETFKFIMSRIRLFPNDFQQPFIATESSLTHNVTRLRERKA